MRPARALAALALRRRHGRTLALVCALLGTCVIAVAPAEALSQRGHVFSFAFGNAGKGEGQFSIPDGIAVNSSTGDVYVADHKNKALEQFKTTFNTEGQPVKEDFVRSIPVAAPSSIAVDNAEGSPSKGDVYVVGGARAKAIYKFDSVGGAVGEPIKKFGKAKFEAIKGLAVDSSGNLFAYQEDGVIDKFSNAVVNVGQTSVQAGLESGVKGQPGFGIDSEGHAYADAESRGAAEEELAREEGRAGVLTTAAKLETNTGKVLTPALDAGETSAIAVNPIAVPGNEVDEANDVYLANVLLSAGQSVTTVAQFGPDGSLIQRFGAPGVSQGDAIAVDSKTGAVYVADAASDNVDVFTLESRGAATVEHLASETVAPVGEVPSVTRLSAAVNPHGAKTEYHLEYGTERCGASACTQVPPGTLEGFGDHSVGVQLPPTCSPTSGAPCLSSGTYFYRVVAKNEKGEARSEQTFTILGLVSELPADNRAWEMVSPPNKDGAEPESLTAEGGEIQAAEGGGAMTFVADGPMPAEGNTEGNRAPEPTQVLSSRSSTGWVSRNITTPQRVARGVILGSAWEYQLFSPNLALGLVDVGATGSFEEPPLSPPTSKHEQTLAKEGKPYLESTVYLRSNQPLKPTDAEKASYEAAQKNGKAMTNGGFLALVTNANFPGEFGGGTGEGPEFMGATPDLSHVVFATGRDKPGLYEWGATKEAEARLGGEKELLPVSVLPGGETPQPHASLGAPEGHNASRAISNDGSLVVWTLLRHLYVRNTVTRETLQVDTVQPGASGEGDVNALFQTAGEEQRPDGSRVLRVFFTDPQRLTPGSRAVTTSEGIEQPDLYVADVSEGSSLSATLSNLTPEGTDRRNGDVLTSGAGCCAGGGVIGASEDGSYVYFVANGALAPGAARGHCGQGAAFVGTTCNLYLRHYDGTGWEASKLIAVLSVQDAPDWGVEARGNRGHMTARVSPNGRFLAFMSARGLTGYNNEDQSSKAPGERMDEEVFLYDASKERLVCASCNPTGARPVGVFDAGETVSKETGEGTGLVVDRPMLWGPKGEANEVDSWLAGSIPGWTQLALARTLYQSRYLSNEGRLFFNSADALVPLATPRRQEEVNGKEQEVGVENVYEYEPNGMGSCHSTGGCVGLISSGTSPHESAFLDASASGKEVFFLTAEKLPAANGAIQDVDTNFDVYDAHACEESSPCSAPAVATASSCEEAPASTWCTGAVPHEQKLPPPLGATIPTSGNITPKLQVKGSTQEQKPTKPETAAQKLNKTLKACRKKYKHDKHRRVACEKQARKKYASKSKAKHK
jgi:DNA-binding beta-propeller fold protein YncE